MRAFEFAFLALLALAGLFALFAGRWLQVADPLTSAEVVLPLAGDRQRPLEAADLLLAGYAERLAITRLPIEPVSASERYVQDVIRSVIERGVEQEAVVVVPGVAPTTYRELENVRDFAEREGWTSLLLVTSTWHTRRTRAIARQVFRNTEIAVSVRPSPEERFSLGWDWWRDDLGRETVLSEYAKLAALLLGVH